jgi:hypothetical protein
MGELLDTTMKDEGNDDPWACILFRSHSTAFYYNLSY